MGKRGTLPGAELTTPSDTAPLLIVAAKSRPQKPRKGRACGFTSN